MQPSSKFTCVQIFVLGGSWSGGVNNKKGEVFDPARPNAWRLLQVLPHV
jgi:hypothetical protein